MRRITFIILAILLSSQLMAQIEQYAAQPFDKTIAIDFPYGDYTRKEINMKKYDKDPLAHALVLKEYGKAWITSNGNKTMLGFEYHVKIKIFESKAFNKGYVVLPFYIRDKVLYEDIKLSSIKAITHYADDKGIAHAVSIDPDSIYTIKENKHWGSIKFNMPALRNGCIIEYKYILESPFLEKLRTWEFQSDIPKVYSEYEVHIPKVFGYNVSLRGPLKLSKDTIAIEKNCFSSTNLNSDCMVEDYEMRNIPAFNEEPYLSIPRNSLSALYFQLTEYVQLNDYVNLNQAYQLKVGRNWTDADRVLKYSDNFGSQLSQRSIFKDRIKNIITEKTDSLDKAKTIYSYIQKTISFNDLYSIYSDDGIKKALDTHTGNVADINLALVTALNAAGIKASPVLISTRDNLIVNKLYPALTEFNYVIAMANINGKTYLLDATEPLPFGMLPFRCLNNDGGRVISLNEPSYWININILQKKTNSYVLDLTLNENGKLTGTITHNSIGYAAYENRKVIKSFKTTDNYIKDLFKNLPELNIIKSEINNLDSLNMPLTEVYEVEMNTRNDKQLIFDPFILNRLVDNPFKQTARIYPLDLGMLSANGFTLIMHLPDNYTVETSLQNIAKSLPNNGGGLVTSFESNGNTITYSHEFHLDKRVYSIEKYIYVKQLFDDIIRSEDAAIILNRKN